MAPRTAAGLAGAATVEVALHMGAVALGIVLRLLLLDARPLSIEEGQFANESFRIWQGQPADSLRQGPLLAYGTALLIGLFAEGDGAARLLSVLAGSALVAVPYLLRRQLGSVPALLAAYGFALSPVVLFASRHVSGGVVPAALALLLWWLVSPGLKTDNGWRPYAVALALGGLVASGSEGVTALFALGAASFLSHPQPSVLLAEMRWGYSSPAWRRAAATFVAAAIAVGSGLGANLGSAQSVVVDVWANWLGSFSFGAPRGGVLALLALYELPVLILGLAQLVRTVPRRDRTDMLLSLWAMLLLLLGMLQDTGTVSRMVLPLLPLYLLAARLIGDSLALAQSTGRGWGWWAACLAVAVPASVGVVLLNRASAPGGSFPELYRYVELPVIGGASLAIGLVHIELGLIVVAGIVVALILDGRARIALGWFAASTLVIGFMVHTTFFLNYRQETVAMEPLVGRQLSPFLRDAAGDAAYFSTYYNAPVSVDPQLRDAVGWYLRGARNVQYGSELSKGISFAVAPRPEDLPGLGSERRPGIYSPAIDSRSLSWQGLWRWAVFRDGLVRSNQRDIIVRAPAGDW